MYPTYDIDRALDLHPPQTPEAAHRCDTVRAAAKEFAKVLQTQCPATPELTLAFRKNEEALFYGIASIVRP